MNEQGKRFQNKLSNSGRKGKRNVEFCDLEGHSEVICDCNNYHLI